MNCEDAVGRTPWPATDAMVRLVEWCSEEADQGVGCGRRRPPHRVLLAAGLMMHAALLAQTQPMGIQPGVMSFQPVQSLSAGGQGTAMPLLRADTGKPFSATVTTQTKQTLMDGTHVSQTMTMVEYRDAEGRVRAETGPPAVITIRDSVAGVTYRLDPAKKSAMKMGAAGPPAALAASASYREAAIREIGASMQSIISARNDPNKIVEDLGTTTVNGVPAIGTRITTIVRVGAIGNDREFPGVDERWFSDDLNLLIKSVNTDPRFGTTTYELTNISRRKPDPSLFVVPADYSYSTSVIEAIEFPGLRRVPQDTMRAIMMSRVGGVYDEQTVQRDFTALWATKRFSDIRIQKETGDRGGIVLRVIVTERTY